MFEALLLRWRRRRWADDYRAGVIASTLFNVFRATGAKPSRPEDFMPKPAATPEPTASGTHMLDTLVAFTVAMGGRPPRR